MKKTNILGLSLVSILALTACGGGSSSNDDAKTGTAYYLDSAVSGVKYKCGDQEGLTGTDGSFTFEEGKECTFYLGSIKLRDIDKSELTDGAKIVEEDIKIATLLQTLDSDGNPENGITIKKEIVEAMATSLSEDGGDGTLPDTATELEVLVASLEHVEGYSGHAVTQSDAQTHLDGTKTKVTKALLAGKTFYVVGEDGDENGKLALFKLTVNKDATMFTSFKEDGTKEEDSAISIVGNKLTFTRDDDGSYTLIFQKDGYIFADDRYADGSKDKIGHRLYTSKAKAQAYFDSIKTEAPFKLSDLVGKTLYQHVKQNAKTAISEITVQSDGKLKIVEFGNTEFIPYRTAGNTLYTTDDGQEEAHTVLEHTNKYVKFSDGGSETSTFYYTRADAEAAPIKEIGEGSGDASLLITPNMLNGKVFYLSHDENDGTEVSYGKASVTSTTQISFHEIRLKKSDKSQTMDVTNNISYSLVNGALVLYLEDGEAVTFSLTSKNSTQWNLSVKESDGSTFTDSWYYSKPSNYHSGL